MPRRNSLFISSHSPAINSSNLHGPPRCRWVVGGEMDSHHSLGKERNTPLNVVVACAVLCLTTCGEHPLECALPEGRPHANFFSMVPVLSIGPGTQMAPKTFIR